MDPRFTPIREETHRFSPYVRVLIQGYIEKLERQNPQPGSVPAKFKTFVDSLGTDFQSEHAIASIGSRNRGDTAKTLYAMKVLLRDVRAYYGERVENDPDGTPYEIIFRNNGSFRSETLDNLRQRHNSMAPLELARAFTDLGIELRQHLSLLRENRRQGARGDDEEVNQLKKLNEIVASVTGLFAAGRLEMDPVSQAKFLVDLLYLEGLYSKKQRKSLTKELSSLAGIGTGDDGKTKAFYGFLNYMNGLAYAKMDEALGEAARAYSKLTNAADNYMEVQGRKSSLQILGQLHVEVFQNHRSLLKGKRDIHLSGKAQGTLTVFRSEAEIARFLRDDPTNGADTIWVLKTGLNMPNEASFAAIILEDPIMKASHYDGYARSKNPPIPLMQIPDASKLYAKYHGKSVLLEASSGPSGDVVLTETDRSTARKRPLATRRIRLADSTGRPTIFEIDGTRSNEEIRELQSHVGSKAANYAFLRSVLPLNPAENEEHIYPGYAIPYSYYRQHAESSRADELISRLGAMTNSDRIREYLQRIRERILNHPVDRGLLESFQRKMESGFLRTHHTNDDGMVKLRFRSSSNAEDNKDFSGAGLYESHFAFYTYQQENRSRTRAYNEATQASREGIATAMRSVWASLWNAEAYFARERAGIVQETVRMGILVHPSYRKEESTGVVFYYAPNDVEIAINKGNENVQNPRIAGLTPEMHRITDATDEITHSSRYSISETVILSKNDRSKLMNLLDHVIPKFQNLYPDRGVSSVDIEFKVLELTDGDEGEKDVVFLKQIRPLAKRQ